MTKRIGAAILAVATIIIGLPAISLAQAATGAEATQKPQAIAADVSTRRRDHQRYHYAYRPYYPYYYGRPYYYSPGPLFFLPTPPLWGYGWEWW